MEAWIAAVSAANVVGVLLVALDKALAKAGSRRLPEAVLLLGPTPFGAAGVLVGVALFRHKTRKPRFLLAATCLLALGVGLAVAWARRASYHDA